MSKFTTKKQLEVLLELMQANPEVATGYPNAQNKESFQRFWKNVETELNSLGPPSKSVFEWKKVWSDKKKYVRKKVASSLKGRKSRKLNRFSALEEAVIRLITPSKLLVSAPESSVMPEASPVKVETPASPPQQVSDTEDEIDEATAGESDASVSSEGSKTSQKSVDKRTVQLLEKKLAIQQELCNTISLAVTSLSKQQMMTAVSLKKIYRSIDRIAETQKLQLAETKRHNKRMESLRRQEIDTELKTKARLLEIEEIKLRHLNM